jgi:hypothetical protein
MSFVKEGVYSRDVSLEAAFLQEEFECLDVVTMIREELPCSVNLQGMNLMKGHKLIPARLGTGQPVKLLRRSHDAADSRKISFLVRLAYIVPRYQDTISKPFS